MSQEKNTAADSPGVAVAEPKEATSQKPRKQPPYNVVLIDDPDHTYDYVIRMLGRLFRYDSVKAYKMAKEVDTTGRVIVMTTTKELAELKRDQIHAFGADPAIPKSKGSMRAVIEPVEG